MRVAFVWQRFLEYHVARLGAVARVLRVAGHDLVAVEVATADAAYGFPVAGGDNGFERRVCFLGENYHSLSAARVRQAVLAVLRGEGPEVVFAPATAFPEGMAAINYRLESGARVVMMDDAWEGSDQRGPLTRAIKRLVHRNVDGAFIPAPSHAPYFRGLGFPDERIVFGVDAVDNDYFAAETARVRAGSDSEGAGTVPYFLFVGRILRRKGLESLLRAYASYRTACGAGPWGLVVVGGGPGAEMAGHAGPTDGISFVGPCFGPELCESYARAGALVVPSLRDPWSLVVNEGMASGLPVLVSQGCGCARTLVQEGENGWTFEAGDWATLARLMARMAALPAERRVEMGRRSAEVISQWGLARFVNGVEMALQVPRRGPAPWLSDLVAQAWMGRVTIT